MRRAKDDEVKQNNSERVVGIMRQKHKSKWKSEDNEVKETTVSEEDGAFWPTNHYLGLILFMSLGLLTMWLVTPFWPSIYHNNHHYLNHHHHYRITVCFN